MISRFGKVFCFVFNLERYIVLVGINIFYMILDYLFKFLVKVRFGYKVIEKVKLFSYICVREFIVGFLSKFVFIMDIISLYLFRVGGVILVVNV